MSKSNPLGYLDLQDAEYVYKALLGYGMFTDRLPPCFSSEGLLKDISKLNNKSHAAITYMDSRNTGVARQLAIPHPHPYFLQCQTIKKNWKKINTHIGKPNKKFNFCHVRKIKNKNHIFEMNYEGHEKWDKEEIEQDYFLGCSYVVKADISTCFPSIYTHSIPWALQGKQEAKGTKNTTNKTQSSHWSNDLDREVRNCNDQQTNGLLIGPHTSNIISEIILTAIDFSLQKKEIKKVIRHIDDYTYFAKNEKDARKFITTLELALKEYELQLNQKKTEIISLDDYFSDHWVQKLNRFFFSNKSKIGFTTINAYLNYALSLAKKENDFAPMNFAIKVISEKLLSDRAKRLYVKKIFSLALKKPYLLSLLKDYVLCFMIPSESDFQELFQSFLENLYENAIENSHTDALAFIFYFALKYKTKVWKRNPPNWQKCIIERNDCISMLLSWKYCKKHRLSTKLFDEKAEEIKTIKKDRVYDQFWLFLYEHANDENDIPDSQKFLKYLKEKRISFLKI